MPKIQMEIGIRGKDLSCAVIMSASLLVDNRFVKGSVVMLED